MAQSGTQLRERLARGERIVAMGAWDVLSAKIMQRSGIGMLSLNSFALSSVAGVPDVGLRTATDLLDITFKMAGEVDLPLVLDIEQGFGSGPGHAAYWAREFERAGAAAVLIDDKGPVQSCGWLPGAAARISVGPVAETAAKVRAMAEARRDGLVIVVRCSLGSGAAFDADEEMRRLHAYAEAGADMLYAPKHATMANDLDRLRRARDELGKPLFVQFNPPGYIKAYVPAGSPDGRSIADRSYAELFEAGASVIHCPQIYPVVYRALLEVLREIMADGSLRPAGPRMLSFDELLDLVGYRDFQMDVDVATPTGRAVASGA